MSLINETLNNLKQTDKDTKKSGKRSSRASLKVQKITVNSPLVLFIIFGIFVSLFFIMYHLKASKNSNAHQSMYSKSTTMIHAKSLHKKIYTSDAKLSAQQQYYDVINFLNDGKLDQAKESLKVLLDQYPTFEPAKKTYAMFVEH